MSACSRVSLPKCHIDVYVGSPSRTSTERRVCQGFQRPVTLHFHRGKKHGAVLVVGPCHGPCPRDGPCQRLGRAPMVWDNLGGIWIIFHDRRSVHQRHLQLYLGAGGIAGALGKWSPFTASGPSMPNAHRALLCDAGHTCDGATRPRLLARIPF